MPGPAVYCHFCGTIFESRAFSIKPGVSNVTFTGLGEICANCGMPAQIVDGTFDVSKEGILSLISGPPLSKAVVEQLGKLLNKVVTGEVSKDRLQEEADLIDPDLGKIVKVVKSKGLGLATLILLFMFLKTCSLKVDASLDLNKLYDQWTEHGHKTVYVAPVAPLSKGNVKNPEKHQRSGDTESRGNGPSKK
jgi:hypothetical protein